MDNCQYCGKPMRDNQEFCSFCGQPLKISGNKFYDRWSSYWNKNLSDSVTRSYERKKNIASSRAASRFLFAFLLLIVAFMAIGVIALYISSRPYDSSNNKKNTDTAEKQEDVLESYEGSYDESSNSGNIRFSYATKSTFDRDAYSKIVPHYTSLQNYDDEHHSQKRGDALVDGKIQTAWITEEPTGDEAFIQFDGKQEVIAIGIWPGNQVSKEDFYNDSRPKNITLTCYNNNKQDTIEWNLTDESIEQIIVFEHPVELSGVRLRINEIYLGKADSKTVVSDFVAYAAK